MGETAVPHKPDSVRALSETGFVRRVVITDVASAYPVHTRPEADAQVLRSGEIWRGRLARLNAAMAQISGPEVKSGQATPAVYFGDPEAELPVRCLEQVPSAFVLTSERVCLHLLETLLDRAGSLAQPVHISHGDPANDVSKPTFMAMMGVPLPPELADMVMDPLGIFALIDTLRRPSVARVVEASASGSTALVDGFERVRSGGTDTALVVSSGAHSIPIPWDVVVAGAGPDRSVLPFSDGSSGHFEAEGGVALLLREEESARRNSQRILGRVSGWATGTFGSGVVNRMVVADVVLRCLASAGVPTDAAVLVDLYGRGNSVDDSAELSAVERVQRTYPRVASAYLKGDRHYVVGSHGLQGLVRILSARSRGERPSDLALHPDGAILQGRRMAHLVADPADYTKIVVLTYSMRGSCIAVLVDLEVDDGRPAGSRAPQ